MPKATLRFILPEEESEFKLALNAGNMDCAIRDFEQYLRGLLKHGIPQEFPKEVEKALDAVRDKFRECLRDNEINI